MPRADADGSQREPSAVFLEAAAALFGRPGADGRAAAGCPDLHHLRRDCFLPARRGARGAHRRSWPVSAAAWASAVARGRPPPASWHAGSAVGGPRSADAATAIDLTRLRAALRDGGVDPAEGLLGDGFALALPGEAPDRPISASGLHDLLRCPHRFLFQRILGWHEVDDGGTTRSIDAMSYGSLFSRVRGAVLPGAWRRVLRPTEDARGLARRGAHARVGAVRHVVGDVPAHRFRRP